LSIASEQGALSSLEFINRPPIDHPRVCQLLFIVDA
jgi:hypothetical protein